MASSNKVFIYSSKHTSPYSVNDLKEFFTTENIFSSRDVIVTDLTSNWDGLTDGTFVFPGSQSTTSMGLDLKPKFEKIKQIKSPHNIVGVCAGAFLGPENADLFYPNHTLDAENKRFSDPNYLLSTKDFVGLGLTQDFEALGAFYPHSNYLTRIDELRGQKIVPYHVTLNLNGSAQQFSQIYLSGPGFQRVRETKEWEVVATYQGGPYRFRKENIDGSTKDIEIKADSFSAMIRRQADEKQGGVFLSGTHFEAGVKDSMRFFKDNKSVLSETDIKAIEQEGVKTIVPLLKDTFKKKS